MSETINNQPEQAAAESESTPNAPATEAQAEVSEWAKLFPNENPAKVREDLESSRRWEKRAKENFESAQRVPDLEKQLSDLQSKLSDTEQKVTESTVDAYREAARLFAGIPQEDADLFLTGSDKDTLSKQAARLAEKFAQQQPASGVVPAEGRTPEAIALNSDDLEASLKSALGIV